MPPPHCCGQAFNKVFEVVESHYKLDGVGDTQSLWTFIATNFSINNCYKLVGVGASCSCGAMTWACIATAVPHPP